jgi:hypothetical protein
MLILSIDVGIKNLACCICDITNIQSNNIILNDISCNNQIIYWDNINLSGEQQHKCSICDKLAKYNKFDKFYCNKHAKTTDYFIPKIKIEKICKKKKTDLLKLYTETNNQLGGFDSCIVPDKLLKKDLEIKIREMYSHKFLDFISSVNAKDLDLVFLGRNINKMFNELFNSLDIDFSQLHYVIIENQISPIANRMKSIQGMLTQYFIIKDVPHIEYISAINKLSSLTDKPIEYSERKRAAIELTQQHLVNQHVWLSHFNNHKKKDDLADSYLQLLWYIKNKGFLNN